MADKQALKELLEILEAAGERRRFRALDFYAPYPKQREFHAMGKAKRERLLMAGNQEGKTYAGAAETAIHLTGLYPKDWPGIKFPKPVSSWSAGETSVLVRDGPQKLLCGKPGVKADLGSGLIPRELMIDQSLARGVTDAYDTIQVKHTSGGISTLTFKSYEQGRAKFQSATLDFIWLDEEPDMEIYSECLARFAATGGMQFMTFTPLKGRSDVVLRFMENQSEDRGVVHMRMEDALHIRPEDRAKIIAGYPAHEREARANGVPLLGSGKIFTATEESISEPALTYIPAHWAKLWGIDFGIGHPFAAALILWDKDNDVIHVHHVLRISDAMPINHAAAMKPIGAGVPVAWPQDGTQREKTSGVSVAAGYKAQGLQMLSEHATWPDGGISTEAGILEMQERMATGRFKVANHLSEFFEEYRFYHRKDGQIVKIKDDILSAIRIAVMAKRFARLVQLGGKSMRRPVSALATGIDESPFAR